MRHPLWEKVQYQHKVSAPSFSSAITHQPSKAISVVGKAFLMIDPSIKEPLDVETRS